MRIRKLTALLAFMAGLGLASSAPAQIVGVLPYTLTNGTTADANQVQGNLQYIVNQVNANVATAVTAAISAVLPVGTIVEWSGSIVSIPTGWHICDGTHGTPNLEDSFVVGAGNSYAVGSTGGATSNTPTITVAGHTLTLAEIPSHNHGVTDPGHGHGVTDPGHSHTYQLAQTGPTAVIGGGSSPLGSTTGSSTGTSTTGISIQSSTTGITVQNNGGGGSHTHTASSSAVPTLPPYYALAYIMKTS